MGKSVARSYALLYALRFALVVAVCLVFGLLFGYSAGGAVAWLGQRFAAAEAARSVSNLSPSGEIGKRESLGSELAGSEGSNPSTETLSPTLHAGPNVQDSRSGRPVQADNLRALSSVRTVTHPGEHRETDPNWDYCGNPQCRLCYPVAGSKVASDLPDMPQGYCKRHPQSRDCKPIVVPAPKPLPKATDPPVIASAGLGVVSRETLAWVLVCVFFVGWLVSGFEVYRLRNRQTISDFRETVEAVGLARVRRLVQNWLDKQGHDRCWYYPEIFTELARALELQHIVLKPPQLPTLDEFRAGCERFQREEYPEKPIGVLMHDSGDSRRGTPASLTHDGQVVFVRRRPELRDIKLNISFDKPKAQEPSEGKHLPVARPIRVSAGHIPESARCDAGDLCTLHKPCAKHGGKPGQPIEDAEADTQNINSDERGTDST
jgi:hypothetical protein